MDRRFKRLRAARVARGYKSMAAFARQVGTEYVTYNKHETGDREFEEVAAKRYAKTLKVDWVWLLTGSGEPPDFLDGVDLPETNDPEELLLFDEDLMRALSKEVSKQSESLPLSAVDLLDFVIKMYPYFKREFGADAALRVEKEAGQIIKYELMKLAS